ncbi:trithorax group protein osa [Aplysia californica]|uniref:Trithorax group protein osa n=1 Tax=Aplysia californica TaxID=6500 RepID=A0ABM1VP04_APLCA|nr:trithorax group protein osa [Aplysia californica]
METIWLQRSSTDIPWGFRLVGGREFGVPLSVQRVTPGSVAAAGLGPGDLVLKVGNVMATNLEHNDAMELVKQAGNILQLTIKKDPSGSAPLSPGSSYGSQNSIQIDSGFKTAPRGGSSNNSGSNIVFSSGNATPNYSTTPRNYGSQIQQSQPQYGTRIEIQRVAPSQPQQQQQQQQQQQRQQPQRSFSNNYSNDYNDSGGVSFPDYTLAYKQQGPVHDSPGGPVDLRGSSGDLHYGGGGEPASQPSQPPQNISYSTQSLPRGMGGYNNSNNAAADRDAFSGFGGPPAYEPRSYNAPQPSSYSPGYPGDSNRANSSVGFNTGIPFQASQPQQQQQQRQQPQQQPQSYASPAVQQASYQPSPSYNNAPQSYNTPGSAGPMSPQPYSNPMSPRSQPNVQPAFSNSVDRRQAPSPYGGNVDTGTPSSNFYQSNKQPSSNYGGNDNSFRSGGFDQSNLHGSGSNIYATLPHTKPSSSYGSPANNNNNNNNNNNSNTPRVATTANFNLYNSAPQPYSAPKPFTPTQPSNNFSPTPSYTANNSAPTPYSPAPYSAGPKPYQSPMSPVSSSGQQQPLTRRVSFDQSVPDNSGSSFSPRGYHVKSPPPPPAPVPAPYTPVSPGYGQHDADFPSPPGITDFGAPPQPQPSFSRQSSRGNNPYSSPSPYGAPPGGPMSPSSGTGSGYGQGYGANRGYEPVGVSSGMDNLNLGSPAAYEPPPPPAPVPPPPPPPPPPPSGPPPPPAPPLNNWNPTPYRRPNTQPDNEDDGEKVPDQLLNTMLKSQKGGGPKPFSYGIDLSELKKKIGPPTAPKPRKGGGGGRPEPDEYQDDPREAARGPPKKPAGYVQSDYFLNRDGGPRSEIDDSSINVNMGTNPKKQSKSFKVLQWMTETEQDDAKDEEKQAESGEPTQKTRRSKDPERRHNADDDEMRFSGLHSKADIPSKAFGRLQKMPSEDRSPVTQNGKDTLDVGDGEEGVGNYDETSIRYKGKHIPSPSFRVLQTWAEHDPDNFTGPAGGSKKEEEDDDLPETLNSEEMVDKRYKGGNIPSKVFKVLQKAVGDDTPEEQQPTTSDAPTPAPAPAPASEAPATDF